MASPQDIQRINQQVGQLYQQGHYEEAIALAAQSRDLTRHSLGEDHPNYAQSLNNLALLYHSMGNYAAAEPLYRQASAIYGAALGEDHPHYASSLNNLAALYESMGNYAGAEPLYRQALAICRAALGEDHPDYAQSLNNLAGLSQSMGNYAAAEPLYRQALAITRAALGEDHPDYAQSLNNLAGLSQSMGNYAAAEPLYRQALAITRAALGEDHPNYASSLNNLAALYESMGNYAAAEPLYRQALAIRRAALGEDHPNYASSLNNLAGLSQSMGNYAAAEPLFRQALAIRRAALGEDHPDYASSLNNLAALYESMGNYAAAEPLYRQALAITRAALGEDHPDYASSLNNLAELYRSMGNDAAAEPLYRQALAINLAALGEDHPDYASSLNNLAALYAATGRVGDARPLMEQAAAIKDRMIGQVFSFGSEDQRTTYLNMVQVDLEFFLSLVWQHLAGSAEAVQAALALVLRRKAIGAEALAAQRDAVLGGKYPQLEPRLQELATLARQIARKTLAGPGPEGVQTHRQLLHEWRLQKDRLEADLARQVPEMNLEERLRAADRRAVALGLPAGVALVEFVRFHVYDFHAVPARGERRWKPARYLAFVLPAGQPDDVQMIDLGEAEPIDRMIADFRDGITGEADRDMRKHPPEPAPTPPGVGVALRMAVLDTLVPALGGRTRLLLAPDGALARLPFEVLPAANGRLVVDDYALSYLGCGRDVLRFGAASTGQPAVALVAADPDFDLDPKGPHPHIRVSQPSRPAPPKGGLLSRLLGRGRKSDVAEMTQVAAVKEVPQSSRRRSRDLEYLQFPVGRLPATRPEGERIAAMLGVTPWLGPDVLEGRLKAECRSPRILHLATHGFFLEDQKRDPNQDERGLGALGGAGRMSGPLPENPLLRAGLVLAGVNTWHRTGRFDDRAEDGLLTAEDVSGLDLLATELVVLSACETGLGEVRTGEGVFGLQRAFTLAGAKTLVMSLWSVPDEQTRALMEDFYRRILAGEPRAEALRAAQMAIRREHPDPFYWGAFICQGNPGPLAQINV